MRRLFVFAAAIAVTTSAFAQLDVVDANGKKVGTATHTLSTAGGKITNKIVMKMSEQGANVTMTMNFVHTSVGDPLTFTMNMAMTGQGGGMNADSKVTFSGKKATLTINAMGQKQTKTATAPGTVRDPSAVWVTGKVPAVGTKATYYQLDPMGGTYSKSTSTYHGLRDLKVGGKTVKAHVVTSTEGNTTSKYYFTSKGELLKLESPQFTLVKR